MIVSCASRQELIETNQERANTIVRAIYKYEASKTTFPAKLNDLVPEFMESIPLTTSGADFFYSTDSVNGFNLSFDFRLGEREGFGCGYTDKTQSWECGYGD
jgi:hypothetical protein